MPAACPRGPCCQDFAHRLICIRHSIKSLNCHSWRFFGSWVGGGGAAGDHAGDRGSYCCCWCLGSRPPHAKPYPHDPAHTPPTTTTATASAAEAAEDHLGHRPLAAAAAERAENLDFEARNAACSCSSFAAPIATAGSGSTCGRGAAFVAVGGDLTYYDSVY